MLHMLYRFVVNFGNGAVAEPLRHFETIGKADTVMYNSHKNGGFSLILMYVIGVVVNKCLTIVFSAKMSQKPPKHYPKNIPRTLQSCQEKISNLSDDTVDLGYQVFGLGCSMCRRTLCFSDLFYSAC